MRLQRAGSIQAMRAHFKVAAVGFAGVVAQGLPVVARWQTETRLDPALEHGAFAAVGIKTPAANHADVIGLGAVFPVATEACSQPHLFRPFKAKVHRQVIGEDGGQRFGRGGVQAFEEVAMQFGDAVEQQRNRIFLVGQATQHHGRQIAAIDRQTRIARQRCLVITPTKDVGFVASLRRVRHRHVFRFH